MLTSYLMFLLSVVCNSRGAPLISPVSSMYRHRNTLRWRPKNKAHGVCEDALFIES